MFSRKVLSPEQKAEKARELAEQKRIEAICKTQEKLEKEEIVQSWNIVFGNIKPKKKKEIAVIQKISIRNIWLEELFLFNEIMKFRPHSIFHHVSKYSLQWKPPGSSYTLIVPLTDILVQERTILNIAKLASFSRDRVIFYFVPLDPSIGLFAPPVHPSSLLSFRSKVSVLKQLCLYYTEGRIALDEFNKIMTTNYDVWCLTLFNLLSEEEQQYHTYLTQVSPKVVDHQNIESKYYHDLITIQQYEDLKFPERKKKKDEEMKQYPLPYTYGKCVICKYDKIGLIKCQNCFSLACVACITKQFLDPETKDGCFLLMHRKFCLRLGKLPACVPQIVQEPSYLRELRDTGRVKAMELLLPKADDLSDDEDDKLSADDDDDEENEEEQRLREEAEKHARECPPELQEIKIYVEVLLKKKDKQRKDIIKYQRNIEDPGHSEMYTQRNVRLKDECLAKLTKVDRDLEKYTLRVVDMGLQGQPSIDCLNAIRDIRQDITNLHEIDTLEKYIGLYNVLTGVCPTPKNGEDEDDEEEA